MRSVSFCKNMFCQPLQSWAGRGLCYRTAPRLSALICGSCIQSTGLQDLGDLSVRFTGEELAPGRLISAGTKKVGCVDRTLIDSDSFLVEKKYRTATKEHFKQRYFKSKLDFLSQGQCFIFSAGKGDSDGTRRSYFSVWNNNAASRNEGYGIQISFKQ